MKKRVKIYKSPEGKGKYINKTNKFLDKMQEGGSVNPVMVAYQSNAFNQLNSGTDPEDVYYSLITAGLDTKTAGSIVSSVIAKMIDKGLFDPDYFENMQKVVPQSAQTTEEMPQEDLPEFSKEEDEAIMSDADHQKMLMDTWDDYGQNEETSEDQTSQLSMQEGGFTEAPVIPFDTIMDYMPGEGQMVKFPRLSEYLNDYNPVQWTDIMKEGGMTKKKFVKSLLKKQEGGEETGAGQGDRQDTLTGEIEKRNIEFKNTLKNLSTEALGKDIYDKALKLGDPELLNIVDGMQNGENGMNLPQAQRGGTAYDVVKAFTDARKQQRDAIRSPYEGYEIMQATPVYNRMTVPYGTFTRRGLFGGLRDLLLPANRVFTRYPYIKSGPAMYEDGTMYEGAYGNLSPVKREVTKTNIFGKPKKWTDYFTEEVEDDTSGFVGSPEKLIDVDEEELRDLALRDLKGSTRRGIKRAERKVAREEERAARNPEGEFAANVPQPYKALVRGAKRAADFIKEKDIFQTGGFTNDVGVNKPTPVTFAETDPTGMAMGIDPSQSFAASTDAFMNVDTPTMDPSMQQDNINVAPGQETQVPYYGQSQDKKVKRYDPNLVKIQNALKQTAKVTNPEGGVNLALAGIDTITGIKNRRDMPAAEEYDAMDIYANTAKTYKGEEADIAGKQLGLKRFDEMGQMDYTGTATAQFGRQVGKLKRFFSSNPPKGFKPSKDLIKNYELALSLENQGLLSGVPAMHNLESWAASKYNTKPVYKSVSLDPYVKKHLSPLEQKNLAGIRGTTVTGGPSNYGEFFKDTGRGLLMPSKDYSTLPQRDYMVKMFADEAPLTLEDQLLRMGMYDMNYGQNNFGEGIRNFNIAEYANKDFGLRDVPSGSIFDEKLFRNAVPIIGDLGEQVRRPVNVINSEALQDVNKFLKQEGGLVEDGEYELPQEIIDYLIANGAEIDYM